jgi:hypothetical protein
VDTHFRDLIVMCPDDGVDLVKRYLQVQSVDGARVAGASPVPTSSRFKKWLSEEAPLS